MRNLLEFSSRFGVGGTRVRRGFRGALAGAALAGGVAADTPFDSGHSPGYFADFEAGAGTEWSSATTDNSVPGGFSRFAGRFGNGGQTLSLSGLTAGTAYTVVFDLYVIDSWDGNSGGVGPDYFNVAVDGVQLFQRTFSQFDFNNQSYPLPPDAQGQSGFSGWNDSIYRSVEVPFTAAGGSASITFQGAGLQDLTDESWGIDNVGVWTTASLPATAVVATSLPAEGPASAVAIDRFSLTTLRPLDASAATSAANYELRSTGTDNLYGTSDDVVYVLTPAYPANTKTVSFTVTPNPLQPGQYRFRTLAGLLDANGDAVTQYTREFALVDPVLGKIEGLDNNLLPGATPLPMAETPAGSKFYTAFAPGTFQAAADVDYWRFDAEAGDVITVRLETANSGIYPYVYLRNAADANVAGYDIRDTAVGQIQTATIPAPGTYYLRVWSDHGASPYAMRVDQSRGLQLETEGNDSQGAANLLALSISGGELSARVGASLPVADSAGDYFSVGTLNAGNTLTATLVMPAGSSIAATDVTLTIEQSGNASPLESETSGTATHTVAADGIYVIRATTADRDLRAQYLLSVTVNDAVPPAVTSATLPDEGATGSSVIDRFSVGFSEDMIAATVNAAANYELRCAGLDGAFGTGDDGVYTVAPQSYATGLSASYLITDGPLQPGAYRLTIGTALQDRAGNPLAAPYERTFTVAGIAGYVMENRNNGVPAVATSLSTVGGGLADGSARFGGYFGGPANNWYPHDLAKGDFNGDGKLDVVTANWNVATVSVYLGNGDGTFQAPTSFACGDNPCSVAVGDLDGDGHLDVVVANYYANTVAVLLGDGTGALGSGTTTAVGANPWDVAVGNLDGAGAPEIVTANFSSDNASVLARQGDGTYTRTDYASGDGTHSVAIADLDGDGAPELVTVNAYADTVSVLVNKADGTGTFNAATTYPTADYPRDLAIGDLDGDGKAEVVTLNVNSRDVSVLKGKGDATFDAPVSYGGVGSDPYRLALGDLSGDGRLDVAVAVYGDSDLDLFLNQGDGALAGISVYQTSYNPIAVVAADFNADGLTDLVTTEHTYYAGYYLTTWLGNREQPLAEDPVGSGLWTGQGRGNLSGTGDVDYWSFSAQAGDMVSVATELPGNPNASALFYDVLRPDGTRLTYFYGNYSGGYGQSSPVSIAAAGTYYVAVSYNYQYWGEYRLRVSLARGGLQMESEDNNQISQANAPTLKLAGGRQTAGVAGYIGVGDTEGDYYALGNLTAGTTITLGLSKPAGSPLSAALEVYRADGTKVAAGAADATPVSHTVAAGADAAYYGRVRAVSGAGLLAQYVLSLELADLVPPTITSVSLPAEGATSGAILDRFSVGLSEDMLAATVNAAANYELRCAGPDGTLDTGDDVLYSVAPQSYASGLSASYLISDGPLQPGAYRFTLTTGLEDRAGNALGADYVRRFTVAGVSGFVLESRNNGAPAVGTSLSTREGGLADGSVRFGGYWGAGSNPYDVAAGDFNGDGKLDVAVANISSDNVSVFLGNGDGTFAAAANYAAGDGPIEIRAGDLDGDGKADLVVADYYGHNVGLLPGNGDGTFQAPVNVAVRSYPRGLALADLDGDGRLDIVAGNSGQSHVTVLLRETDGTYGRTDYGAGSGAWGVAVGDLDGDGKLDLVAANANDDNVSVLRGNGNGTFAGAVNYAAGDYPRDLRLGDLDGDGKLDIVVLNANSQDVSVLRGNGDATLGAPVNYGGLGSDPYHLALVDLSADGKLDVAVAVYGSSRLALYPNQGDGTLGAVILYSQHNPIGVTVGDFNGDGLSDLATASHNYNELAVWLGNREQPLAEDPVGSGLWTGQGRGNLSGTGDVDYWSFSAQAGDMVSVATELPGNPNASALFYDVLRPDGTRLTYFYGNYSGGYGQSSPVSIAAAGTYYVAVSYNYQYWGEYRLRVSLARGGLQMESEDNNQISQANAPTLRLAGGRQTADVAGYIGVGDTEGDYYALGNLTAGTTITLGLSKPAGSPLSAALEVYRADGTKVAAGAADATPVSHTVAAGADAAYYGRVRAVSGAGLLAQYVLSLELADLVPPTITSVSLPAEGATSGAILDRFSVGLSEDMLAATVNAAANYELRCAGPDGTLDTGDDVLYSVAPQSYASGLSASYLISDGPLQPGAYRFTLTTGLEDRAGNALGADYVRRFTVAGVSGFVLESRNNGAPAVGTSLSTREGGLADGSVRFGGYWGAGSNPYDVAAGDFNGDGKLDVAVANISSDNVSVFLGNGDGTFAAAANYAAGDGPIEIRAGDLDGDGKADLVVADYYGHNVGLLPGNGDGTFQAPVNVAVRSYPRGLALADLDGDGRLDIVAGNSGQSHVTVLLRETDGTYGRTDYGAGSGAWGVAVGDLDGDGKLDLVAANANDDNVSVLRGNGNGTFAGAVNYAAGDYPRDLRLGDLDGDGKLDIVVLNANSQDVSVLRGNGDATLGAPVNYGGLGSDPYHLALVDLSADGKLDVAVAVYGSSRLALYPNQGDGTLGAVILYSQHNPIGVTVGDFNGDGLSDLATASHNYNELAVWLGNREQPLAEDPVGSGLWTGQGRGNLSGTGDVDYWSFSAQAGDMVSVATELPGNPNASALFYDVLRPDGTRLTYFYGNYSGGYGQSSPVSIAAAGTYYVAVSYNYQYWGEYRLRVSLARGGLQMESEDNNQISQANGLGFGIVGVGTRTAKVAGYIGAGDSNGDYFALGNLTVGAAIALAVTQPASSPLSEALEIYNAAGTKVGDNSFTVVPGADGAYYARVQATANAGLLAQYVLSIEIADNLPPTIASVGLPAEGTTGNAVIDRFSVGFSEDMLAATVNAAANYELRGAGPDGTLDTGDDVLYTVAPQTYGGGLSASYLISDGPLQAGDYRLTLTTGLQDRAGNALAADYRRYFGLAPVPGFAFENRNNGSFGASTSLSPGPIATFDGSFLGTASFAIGSNPYGITAGDLDGDGNGDLVTANYYGGNLSVLLGNGDGTFRTAVGYGTQNNPIEVVLADLNGDGHLDLIAANHGSSSITIRLGLGDGTFDAASQMAVGSNPFGLAVGDLNGDTKPDVAVANYSSHTVSVLLGNGDGTLQTQVAHAFGNYPTRLAIGDFNGDAKPDLATANYNGVNTVTVRLGDGAGAFGTAATYPTPSNPYAIQTADFDGDGTLDLATASLSADSVSVFRGNGDGTFAAKVDYPSGGSSPYHVFATDLNADGRPDLLAANYNSSRLGVLMNRGDGTFGGAAGYPAGGNAIAAVAGDWNNDGRMDLATANYGNSTVSVFLGNPTQALAEDNAAGHGIRTAAGQGNLFDTGDYDYWSFSAEAGDHVVVGVDTPGRPNASGLYYLVEAADGQDLAGFYSDYYGGWGQSPAIAIPRDGTYFVRVSYNHDYRGEYRIRTVLTPPEATVENEDNGSVANATALTLAASGDNQVGTGVGYVRTSGDLDYFDLGTLDSGQTVFLNARLFEHSTLTPVVSLYNASNGYMVEATGGRPFDSVAEVRIVVSGRYYAVVRGAAGQGDLMAWYTLEVQVMPTSSVAFPNLQMVSLTPPSGSGLQSGDPVNVAFTVKNVGLMSTAPVSQWTDRLVLSPNPVYGDLDDIPLAVLSHTGVLDPDLAYTVTRTVNLPDGIEGTYYLIGQTDSGNAVTEFVLEADNVTVSDATFLVTRATYPDLRVENLTAGLSGGNVAVAWQTANRGTRGAPAGFKESIVLKNLLTGTEEYHAKLTFPDTLAADSAADRSATLPLPGAGRYEVRMITDADDAVYEFDTASHASAEGNNQAAVLVDVVVDLQVTDLRVEPATQLMSGLGVTLRWKDSNLGNRSTADSWRDHIVVRNATSGETLLDTTLPYDASSGGDLGPGELTERAHAFTLPQGQRGVGSIQFSVTCDDLNQIVESNPANTAESNNTATVTRDSILAPYADLVVTDIQMPTLGDGGQPVQIRWQDRNQGSSPATGTWHDRVYLSSAADGSGGQLMADVAFTGSLAADGNLARETTFNLPAGQGGTRKIRIETDIADAIPEAVENNNATVAGDSLRVRLPNLGVTAVTVPGVGVAGQPVTVTWTDGNEGDGDTFATTWYDRLWLGTAPDGSGPLTFLKDVQWTDTITAGDSAARSTQVILPLGVPGNRYLVVTTDAYSQIGESDETDNTGVSGTALVLEAPDLEVASASAPASAAFGQAVAVTFRLHNPGTAPTEVPWHDQVYFSPDNVPGNGNDVLLQTRPSGEASPLAAGATSAELAVNVTLPAVGYADGTYYLFVRADGYNAVGEYDEANNWSTPVAVALTPPLRADLSVENIGVPPTAQPGTPFTVTWKTRNVGAVDVSGSWAETVAMSTDNAVGGDTWFATVNFTGTLAVGASVDHSAQITIPLDGLAGDLYAVVTTDAGGSVIEANEANNAAISAGTVNVPLKLRVVVDAAQVREDAAALGFTVSRNGDRTGALDVTLSSGDTSELMVPASVTIPAGQVSTRFTGTPQNDGVQDGDQTMVVSAGAAGFSAGTAAATVQDVNNPVLTLTLPASVGEGQTATATVSRDFAVPTPLVVSLGSSSPGQLTTPTTVTIPANESTTSYLAAAVEDTLLEGNQTYTLTASAAGAIGSSQNVQVVDNDVPGVTVSFAQDPVSEGAGANATTATLTRSIVSDQALSIALNNDRPDKVLVPATMTIPANQVSVTFPVAAVDNVDVDGDTLVTIQPVILSGGVAFALGTPATITVTDDDGPTLTLTLAPKLAAEGLASAATGTISRNTDPTDALEATLTTDAPGEMSVPASVTIPAGQKSTTFAVASLDDGVTDGNKTAKVTASAAGFTSGADTIVITDANLPDLAVAFTDVPATGGSEQLKTVTYRVTNQGVANTGAGKSFVQRLYLSTDPVAGSDKFLGQYIFPDNVPPGQFFDVVQSFYLPRDAAQYWLIAVTDADNQIGELLEDNNVAISAPIQVITTYTASVVAGLHQALAGTEIPLSGQATRRDNGQSVPFALVNIHITVRGTERVFSALCNAEGHYSTSFKPLPGEAGEYGVGADHPGLAATAVQDTFTLVGLKANPTQPAIQIVEGQSATGSVEVDNLSNVALHNLTVTTDCNMPNVQVTAATFDDATSLPGLGARTLTFTLHANDASYVGGTAFLYLATTEGATLTIPVTVSVIDLRPRLVATPGRLIGAMKPGVQTTVPLTLRNDGGEATGPLDVQLPPLSWLAATSTKLASLAPGEETTLMLVLKPTEADGLTPGAPYSGSIGFGNAGYGTTVPFEFRYVTDGKGELWVVAEDEYTYYAEGSPRLAGANVQVLDAYTSATVASGVTDLSGFAKFADLAEGYYKIVVTADKHSTYSEVHFLNAGQVNSVVAFLYRQTVEYNWTVVPTEIEDHTKIIIETTFETFVPVPVVTIDPPYLDMNDYPLPSQQILVTIKNSGLIAAQGAKLQFSEHPWYKITPLVEDVGLVPPMGEVKVPVTIENHVPAGGGGLKLASNSRNNAKLAGVPCTITAGLEWFLICGPDHKWHRVPLPVFNVHGDCGGGGGGGGGWSGWGGPIGGGGGGGGGGGSYSAPVSFGPPVNCDPCDPEVFKKEDIFSIDISSFFEPIGAAVEAAITAQTGGLLQPSVDIEANGGARTCCEPGGSQGIEVYGHAGASLEVAVGPGISKEASVSVDVPGKGEAELSGEIKLGLQATGSLSLSGEVSSGCNFSGLEVTANGQVALRFFGGVSGEMKATYSNPIYSADVDVAAVNGSINGGVRIDFEYKDGAFTINPCSEGLYYSAYAKLFGNTYSLFHDAAGNPLEKVYIIDATCPADDGSLMGRALAQIIPGVEEAIRAAIARQLGPDAAAKLHSGGGGAPVHFSSTSQISLKSRPVIARGVSVSRGAIRTQADEGVCAKVKLRLEQEAVLTRNAFNATLEVVNKDTLNLENVEVIIAISDEAGNNRDAVFAYKPPTLSGLGAIDGTGTINGGTTGRATWILIPTREAAPDAPQVYLVSGTLSYTQNGLQVVVPLQPVPITVYPDPLLYIKYFHQRDVYADDPFTPQIEPSIPYSLAVMAENKGKGLAKNLRITSAQPQIVENEKGLLIDFQIVATQVENDNLSPSLTVNLGNIDPGATKIGRWLLKSTLQGLFIDYKVTFEHEDAIVGKKTALIDDVTIHEMLHLVRAPAPFEDGRPDFLVNDDPDPPTDFPDRLYLSDGSTGAVQVVTLATSSGAPSPAAPEVTLTANLPPGFVYLRVPEPSDGQMRLYGVKQGERVIPLPDDDNIGNAWITDRTFVGEGKKPVNENILHLFDYNANTSAVPVTYTLIYRELPADDLDAPASVVGTLPANSPAMFAVNWSGTDNGGSGIATYDVYVQDNGGAFTPWLTGSALTGSLYTGEVGHTYAFYSRAIDFAGNRESAPATADASTLVSYASAAPQLGAIGDLTTDQGVPVMGLALTVNDADTPAANLKFSADSSNLALLSPANVKVKLAGGQFTLDLAPEPQRFGDALVTLTVSDGSHSDSRAFKLTVSQVNGQPVAGADTITRAAGQSVKVAVSELLANDTDPELDLLNLSAVTSPTGKGATVQLAGGWIFYRPPTTSMNDDDTFTYTVSDFKGGTATGTVTVHVTGNADTGGQNRLQAPVVTADSVTLSFLGIPGRVYRVQRTASLNEPIVWQDLDPLLTAGATGEMVFVDHDPLPAGGFYRTVDTTNP